MCTYLYVLVYYYIFTYVYLYRSIYKHVYIYIERERETGKYYASWSKSKSRGLGFRVAGSATINDWMKWKQINPRHSITSIHQSKKEHIHMDIHTYINTYIHTYTQCMHVCMYVCISTYILYTYFYIRIYIYTYTYIYIDAYTRTWWKEAVRLVIALPSINDSSAAEAALLDIHEICMAVQPQPEPENLKGSNFNRKPHTL